MNGVYPMVDSDGRVPKPPAPAFVIFRDGEPWSWLTADELADHLDELPVK